LKPFIDRQARRAGSAARTKKAPRLAGLSSKVGGYFFFFVAFFFAGAFFFVAIFNSPPILALYDYCSPSCG
jgi:hypothetical protein